MPKLYSACPLDCPDVCSLEVTIEGDVITKVAGNAEHPYTRGAICRKGQGLIKRETDPRRLKTPLVKKNNSWHPITWDAALAIFYDKLQETRQKYGSQAILHVAGAGSAGIIKEHMPERFFNQLGGVTKPSGSLCWGAGLAAQKADFGVAAGPVWSELAQAKIILLWGRDPATTNIHLLPYIKEARSAGCQVIVINPLKIASIAFADQHLAIKPGTDGLLALAMAQVIIEENLIDHDYVAVHVNGFAEFAAVAAEHSPEKVASVVGLTAADIRNIARLYAKSQPAAIVLGYGLQRYQHSGAMIRTIDALAAITGQLVKPGSGVFYGNRLWGRLGNELDATEAATAVREIPWGSLATELPGLQPAIQLLVVDRANPVNQMPDSAKTKAALANIPFKVVIDYFLTDTADLADLLLPATSNFEEEDIVSSSWNEYIYYKAAITKPTCSEYNIWQFLARKFALGTEWEQEPDAWLENLLKPHGLTMADLKTKGYVLNPHAKTRAFADGKFYTASGKMELIGRQMLAELIAGSQAMTCDKPQDSLLLMTPHSKQLLNSQHFYHQDSRQAGKKLGLNPLDAKQLAVAEEDLVVITTKAGSLTLAVRLDDNILPGVVIIEQGGWLKAGIGVNLLTEAINSDIGDQVAFYQTLCTVRKI